MVVSSGTNPEFIPLGSLKSHVPKIKVKEEHQLSTDTFLLYELCPCKKRCGHADCEFFVQVTYI